VALTTKLQQPKGKMREKAQQRRNSSGPGEKHKTRTADRQILVYASRLLDIRSGNGSYSLVPGPRASVT